MNTTDDDNDVSDELMDELMSVLSLMSPKELADFCEADGTPLANWQNCIANWKAEKLQ